MTLLIRTGLRSNRYCSMADFPFFKIAAVRHLGFIIVVNFDFRSGSGDQFASSAKFREDRSNRSGDMADFWFSRWRPSAILDWFYACWEDPRRVLGGLCDCAKFGGNRCSNFDSMQILMFCTLSSKMPIHAPKIGFFWDFTPKMGISMNETPKRHILGRKHVVWRIDRQNKSTCAGSARTEVQSKKI